MTDKARHCNKKGEIKMIVVITKENIKDLEKIYADAEIKEIGVYIDDIGINFVNRTGACGESFQVLDLEKYRGYGFTACEVLEDFIDSYNSVMPEKDWQYVLSFDEPEVKKIIQAKMSNKEVYYVKYKSLPVAAQIKLISDVFDERNDNGAFSDLDFYQESEKLAKSCPLVKITKNNIESYAYTYFNANELIDIEDIELDLNTFMPAENCMLLEDYPGFEDFKDEMVYPSDMADQFVEDAEPKSNYFMIKDGKIVEIDNDTANRKALQLLEKHMCI